VTAGVFRPTGLFGDGRDESAALNAPLNDLRAYGGGVCEIPAGRYSLGIALDVTRARNMTLRGAGMGATVLLALPTFDGGDHVRRNSLIYGVNGLPGPDGRTGDTATWWTDDQSRQHVQARREKYYRHLTIERLTLVLSAQSAAGIPVSLGWGLNLSGVEITDTDDVTLREVEVIDAYGNALCISSMDPGVGGRVLRARILDCLTDNCVRGPLPTYGNKMTGSVIQVQARGGLVQGNQIHRSGGPAIDCFGSFGVDILRNRIEGTNGVQGTVDGRGQFVGSIRSDGDYGGGDIADNTFVTSGSIWLGGLMPPIYQNAYVGWPGPRGVRVERNRVYSLAAENVAAGHTQAPVLLGADWSDVSNRNDNVTRDNLISG